MKRHSLFLLVLAACGSPACAPASSPGSLTLGGKTINVSVITTEKDRRHAVAHLEAPAEGRGYLLAWPRERYMKVESDHSPVGYDVLFLDKSGTIVDLRALKPHDEEGVLPKAPAAWALLVAPGVPAKLGVKAGDKAALSPDLLGATPEELPLMKINGIPAMVELCLTETERQHGLMFRPRMSADDGMLFAYADEGDRHFWMKNTMIPLDIAFFAEDGTLLNVNETPMYPDPRNPGSNYATSDSRGAARYVLEMNLGWFRRKGLVDASGHAAPGTKAELPPQASKGTYD